MAFVFQRRNFFYSLFFMIGKVLEIFSFCFFICEDQVFILLTLRYFGFILRPCVLRVWWVIGNWTFIFMIYF